MRLLKIKSLPSVKECSWIDEDFIMFHSCFECLERWVENENGLEHANYEIHKEIIDVLKDLYNWWIENREDKSLDTSTDENQERLELLIKHSRFLWT